LAQKSNSLVFVSAEQSEVAFFEHTLRGPISQVISFEPQLHIMFGELFQEFRYIHNSHP